MYKNQYMYLYNTAWVDQRHRTEYTVDQSQWMISRPTPTLMRSNGRSSLGQRTCTPCQTSRRRLTNQRTISPPMLSPAPSSMRQPQLPVTSTQWSISPRGASGSSHHHQGDYSRRSYAEMDVGKKQRGREVSPPHSSSYSALCS